jgi:hypothetical protein
VLWIPDQAFGLSGMTAASANLFADEPHGGKETIAQRTKHGKPFTFGAPSEEEYLEALAASKP